jgi:hypothetical protein
VRLERLQMSVKLEKLPEPFIEKAISPTKDRVETVPHSSKESAVDSSKENKIVGSRKTVDKVRHLALTQPKAESRPPLALILEEDDNEEVTFKKANEDKDSGIGNGNASGESSDEVEIVDFDEPSSSTRRKRRRPSGDDTPAVAPTTPATKGKGDQDSSSAKKKQQVVSESADRKKGLITGFFPRTESPRESPKSGKMIHRSKKNR